MLSQVEVIRNTQAILRLIAIRDYTYLSTHSSYSAPGFFLCYNFTNSSFQNTSIFASEITDMKHETNNFEMEFLLFYIKIKTIAIRNAELLDVWHRSITFGINVVFY